MLFAQQAQQHTCLEWQLSDVSFFVVDRGQTNVIVAVGATIRKLQLTTAKRARWAARVQRLNNRSTAHSRSAPRARWHPVWRVRRDH